MFRKAFILNVFFCIFAFFSFAFSNHTSQEIAQGLRWSGVSQTFALVVFLCVVVAIIIIVAIAVVQRKKKEKTIKDHVAEEFIIGAKEVGLNIAEQTLLKSITWTVAPKTYCDVFRSLMIFENAVHVEISKLIKTVGEDNQKTEDTVDMISRIRRKLKFDEIAPEKPLESSRNIEVEQEISLYDPTGEPLVGKTKLLRNNELYFETDFTGLEDFFARTKREGGIIAKFTRFQDAAYSIHLTIRSINTNDNIISFYHTTTLERYQARKYARIFVDTPIHCKVVKREDHKAHPRAGEIMRETALLDISGGGLSFTTLDTVAPDDILQFSLVLNKEKFVIKGKIVAVSAQHDKQNVYYRHRVIFYSAKQSDTERIVKFIYEKQREKIQQGEK
ncbi:MAG: PilZ domain-containing protein [Chitinivibrionia bacterium]|nr:PilZ domain-containing protein [Chitinivibrionia bacterium]